MADHITGFTPPGSSSPDSSMLQVSTSDSSTLGPLVQIRGAPARVTSDGQSVVSVASTDTIPGSQASSYRALRASSRARRAATADRVPSRAVARPSQRADNAGTIVLGANDQEIWQVAGVPSSASFGPPNMSDAMDSDLGATFIQNNVQSNPQQNNVQFNLQEFIEMHQHDVNATANIQQTAVIGVDPQVALQLQQQAHQAEVQTTQVITAASQEVHLARAQAQHVADQASQEVDRARAQAQQATDQAQATVSGVVSEGRAAVAAARGEAAVATATAQAAAAERDAIRRSHAEEQVAVSEHIRRLEEELARVRREQAQGRTRFSEAVSRDPRSKPPRPERFSIGGDSTPSPSRERSPGFHTPSSRPSDIEQQSPPQPLRTEDTLPNGADAGTATSLLTLEQRQGVFERTVTTALATIADRVAALGLRSSHRSNRQGSGRSPSRARRHETQEVAGAPAAATVEATSVATPCQPRASAPVVHPTVHRPRDPNCNICTTKVVPPSLPGGIPGLVIHRNPGSAASVPAPGLHPDGTLPTTIFCSSCGTNMLPNASFCWKCGHRHAVNPIPAVSKPKGPPPDPREGYEWVEENDEPSDDDSSDEDGDDDFDSDDSDDDGDDSGDDGNDDDEPAEFSSDPPPDPTVYCTVCGTPFPPGPGNNFCSVCGIGRPAGPNPPGGPAAGGPGGSPAPSSPGHPFGSQVGKAASETSTELARKRMEHKIVKQREIQSFKLPKLAQDAAEQRGWVNAFLAYIRRFDLTPDGDFLWKWVNRAFQLGVTEAQLRDPEGCPNLDALIASEVVQRHHFADRPKLSYLFYELQAYTERCKAEGRSLRKVDVIHVPSSLPYGFCDWYPFIGTPHLPAGSPRVFPV